MPKSLIIGLVLLFTVTLLGGFLTDNQIDLISNVSDKVFEATESENVETVLDKPIETNTLTNDVDNEVVTYVVVRVIDGDTIIVDKSGRPETIRMIGIDTPETVHPSKPVQCFGKEASEKTKELLTGERVTLEIDETQGEHDKYGRLLAYVYRADGLFVNYELIKQGYAYEYTYNLPYKYQARFKEAEQMARVSGIGLWADTACQ